MTSQKALAEELQDDRDMDQDMTFRIDTKQNWKQNGSVLKTLAK